jgi:Holliday junction resolvase RusA-like endonuclease
MLSGEAKMEINFVVEGSPVVWGVKEREQSWRTEVSSIARQALNEKYGEEVIEGNYLFEVEITFVIPYQAENNRGIFNMDLDNLVKPILDALFHDDNPQNQGNLFIFNSDDSYVVSLIAKKVVSPDNNGRAFIKVRWY